MLLQREGLSFYYRYK